MKQERRKYFLAFDTETGSLNPDTADLLTAYFAILNEDLEVVEDLYLKLKPIEDRLIKAEDHALNVNKLTFKA